eukprot:14216-Heterococcus_DN1.PRE.4
MPSCYYTAINAKPTLLGISTFRSCTICVTLASSTTSSSTAQLGVSQPCTSPAVVSLSSSHSGGSAVVSVAAVIVCANFSTTSSSSTPHYQQQFQ